MGICCCKNNKVVQDSRIEIFGLATAALRGLNGKLGQVTEIVAINEITGKLPPGAKFKVKLDNGEIKEIKPENLQLTTSSPAEQYERQIANILAGSKDWKKGLLHGIQPGSERHMVKLIEEMITILLILREARARALEIGVQAAHLNPMGVFLPLPYGFHGAF
jgi:hypothetical protein